MPNCMGTKSVSKFDFNHYGVFIVENLSHKKVFMGKNTRIMKE